MSSPGEGLPPGDPAGLETDSDEWLAEIDRRAREVISGEVIGEPWEDAIARLLAQYDTD